MSKQWPPDYIDMSTDEDGFGESFVAQFMRRQLAVKGKISHELFEYLKEAPDDVLVEVLVGTHVAAAAVRKDNTKELFHALGSIAFDHLVSRNSRNMGAIKKLRKMLEPVAKAAHDAVDEVFGKEDDDAGQKSRTLQLAEGEQHVPVDEQG